MLPLDPSQCRCPVGGTWLRRPSSGDRNRQLCWALWWGKSSCTGFVLGKQKPHTELGQVKFLWLGPAWNSPGHPGRASVPGTPQCSSTTWSLAILESAFPYFPPSLQSPVSSDYCQESDIPLFLWDDPGVLPFYFPSISTPAAEVHGNHVLNS